MHNGSVKPHEAVRICRAVLRIWNVCLEAEMDGVCVFGQGRRAYGTDICSNRCRFF